MLYYFDGFRNGFYTFKNHLYELSKTSFTEDEISAMSKHGSPIPIKGECYKFDWNNKIHE